jgi:hypothetical protein
MRQLDLGSRLVFRGAALLVGCIAAIVVVLWAVAHEAGQAGPRIAAKVSGRGLVRPLTVRPTDLDSGEPISGATVTASAGMTRPHVMTTQSSRLRQTGAGTYEARLSLLMAGDWTIRIGVTGKDVVSASAELPLKVRLGSGSGNGAAP